MKRIYYILMMFCLAFMGQSCEEDPALDFQDDGKVYFKYPHVLSAWGEELDMLVDSISYSMHGKELTPEGTDTLWVEIQVMGARVDRDRSYKVMVVPDTCNGVEGVDFEALKETYILHAGRGRDVFPVILNRDAISNQLSRSVVLKLEATADLGIAYAEYSTIKINYSAYMPEPEWWWAFSRFLGNYHPLKYDKVVEEYGSPNVDPYGNNPYCTYVANVVKKWFEEHEVIDPFTGEPLEL